VVPTLPGKQSQNRDHEEELHASQETNGKRLEMKVKADPLRGLERNRSEREGKYKQRL